MADMNLETDPTLAGRISKAGSEIYDAIMYSLADGRGANLQTAIAAAGYLAGVAIYKSCENARAEISIDDTAFNQVMQMIGSGPGISIPPEHLPHQSYEQLVTLLWPQVKAILSKHSLGPESAPYACVAPVASMIAEAQAYLPPAVGKAIAAGAVIKASKTAPPAFASYGGELTTREEFMRMLLHTAAQVDALVTLEPKYLVWHQLHQQLQALRQWTANGATPPAGHYSHISIGLIAARELEPAQDDVIADLISRLHLLNYYCRHAEAPAAPVFQQKSFPIQKAARMFLIVLGAVALVGFLISLTFRVKVTGGSPLGPTVAAGKYSANLIQTMEPYMVSLNHNPKDERFTLSLQLTPSGGGSSVRTLDLASGLRAQSFGAGPRILGFDGKYLWLHVEVIKGVNVSTMSFATASDLRRANPTLKNLPGVDNSNNPYISPNVHRLDRPNTDLWSGEDAGRRFSFAKRLRVTTPDFKQELEIDPDSLQAVEVRR
jgi:hypothetical protein